FNKMATYKLLPSSRAKPPNTTILEQLVINSYLKSAHLYYFIPVYLYYFIPVYFNIMTEIPPTLVTLTDVRHKFTSPTSVFIASDENSQRKTAACVKSNTLLRKSRPRTLVFQTRNKHIT
ncbi:hypothetical protein L9F63_023134, partial [Diploptera punctata]